jgi:hypothetical protein
VTIEKRKKERKNEQFWVKRANKTKIKESEDWWKKKMQEKKMKKNGNQKPKICIWIFVFKVVNKQQFSVLSYLIWSRLMWMIIVDTLR